MCIITNMAGVIDDDTVKKYAEDTEDQGKYADIDAIIKNNAEESFIEEFVNTIVDHVITAHVVSIFYFFRYSFNLFTPVYTLVLA